MVEWMVLGRKSAARVEARQRRDRQQMGTASDDKIILLNEARAYIGRSSLCVVLQAEYTEFVSGLVCLGGKLLIKEKTTLVLGAGASEPYGFPVGNRLKKRVISWLGTTSFQSELVSLGFTLGSIENFRDRLSRSPRRSVDRFLEQNRRFEGIGKAAMAAELIRFEDERATLERKDRGWYDYLFNEMGDGPDGFAETPLSVITFNYDRSLEYFLFSALQNEYGLIKDVAREKLREIEIVHVHGQLGLSSFSVAEGEPVTELHREYRNELVSGDLEACMSEMKIIYEQEETSPEFQRAHAILEEARIVAFLGFGYDRTNVRRLQVNERFNGERLLGSGKGLGLDEKRRAEELFSLRPGQIEDEAGNKRRLNVLSIPGHERIRRILIGGTDEDALEFLRNYAVFD
jgi:hypothetical protein